MKKYFFIAVAFLSLLTFNACSSDSPEEELPPKEEPEQPDTPVDPDNPSTSDNVVLAENTILLTDSIDKYVTNPVTGTTLNLETSIDETELPEVGQVLLYGNFNNENVACNFKIAAGPSLAAKLSYDGTEENLYEKLKDNEISIAACKIAVNAGVQISIFKEDNIEVGVDDEELPSFEYEGFFGKKEYYLFPEFKEKNALWKSGNQILAEYDVSRDLLFPVQLGMRLMDKDKRTLKDDVDLG